MGLREHLSRCRRLLLPSQCRFAWPLWENRQDRSIGPDTSVGICGAVVTAANHLRILAWNTVIDALPAAFVSAESMVANDIALRWAISRYAAS